MYGLATLERHGDYHGDFGAGAQIRALPSSSQARYVPSPPDYVARFYELKARWERDTAFTSSLSEIIASPSLQDIMRMGEAAIPLITRELRTTPSLLFLALHGITGENPLPESARGDVVAATNAWLDWASRNPVYVG